MSDAVVSWNVELGYAMTAHRSQGTTVDTGHVALPAGASLNREMFYVAMPRGRQNNAAWVGIEDAGHTLHAPSEQPTWREILAQVLTAQGAEFSATATREHAAEELHSLSRLAAERDHLQALAHLEQGQGSDQDWPIILRTSVGAQAAEQIENSPAKDFLLAHLTRLDRAGHDPATVLAEVASPRELASADDIAAVLAWRLERHRPDVAPPVADPVLADLLAQNQALADARRNVLAARAQTRAEPWTRHLPPPPADPDRRAAWNAAVLAVAAYRDRYDITTTNPLGPTPDTRDRARTTTWRETTQALHHATRKPATTTDQDQDQDQDQDDDRARSDCDEGSGPPGSDPLARVDGGAQAVSVLLSVLADGISFPELVTGAVIVMVVWAWSVLASWRGRRRDAALAPRWEHARRSGYPIAHIHSVYQRARTGTKAVIVWPDGTSQDTWFQNMRPAPGCVIVLARRSEGLWGPHNQHANVLYLNPTHVLDILPHGSAAAAKRHTKRENRRRQIGP